MIIACPECKTRYVVAPAAIGKKGRMVKCSRCAHTWFEEAPAEAVEIVPESVVEPTGQIKDEKEMEKKDPGTGTGKPLKKNVPALIREGSTRTVVGWALLLLLVFGGGFSLYWFRADLEDASPTAETLYEKWDYLILGKKPAPPKALPPVVEVEPHPASLLSMRRAIEIRMNGDKPSLVVTLDFQNDSGVDIELPPVTGIIRDANGAAVFTWTQVLEPRSVPAHGFQQYQVTVDNIPAQSAEAELTLKWPK